MQEVRHRQQEVVVLVGVDPLARRGVVRLEADEGGRLQAPRVRRDRGVEARDVGQEAAAEAVVGVAARDRNDAELGLRLGGWRFRAEPRVRGAHRQRDRSRPRRRAGALASNTGTRGRRPALLNARSTDARSFAPRSNATTTPLGFFAPRNQPSTSPCACLPLSDGGNPYKGRADGGPDARARADGVFEARAGGAAPVR